MVLASNLSILTGEERRDIKQENATIIHTSKRKAIGKQNKKHAYIKK